MPMTKVDDSQVITQQILYYPSNLYMYSTDFILLLLSCLVHPSVTSTEEIHSVEKKGTIEKLFGCTIEVIINDFLLSV